MREAYISLSLCVILTVEQSIEFEQILVIK
jgi:hypothetical protein